MVEESFLENILLAGVAVFLTGDCFWEQWTNGIPCSAVSLTHKTWKLFKPHLLTKDHRKNYFNLYIASNREIGNFF